MRISDWSSDVCSSDLMLAALAARTTTIRLGHAVQVLPVHNPLFLAEEYGMVDVLSGGRLEVGLGRGNFDFEWDRYEEDRADAPARSAGRRVRKEYVRTCRSRGSPGY